jgi:trk system potassium uptake protein TrkH
VGLSVFHSISAFNNAGFDLLGNFESLARYYGNVYFNIVTCALIFLGGIGFLVIKEIIAKRFRWKKLSMHSKVVLTMSAALIVIGALLFKLTEENLSWMGAIFASVSARTAGFATASIGSFSSAGLLIMIALMIIGASPGSTGGGIKTSTFFVLAQGIRSSATNKSERAFKYTIPKDSFKKAAVIVLFALSVVFVSTIAVCAIETGLPLSDVLFEMASAMGTAGLSTGITPSLSVASKIITMIVMYIGRLGAWSIVTLWSFSRDERISYPEGNIAIG